MPTLLTTILTIVCRSPLDTVGRRLVANGRHAVRSGVGRMVEGPRKISKIKITKQVFNGSSRGCMYRSSMGTVGWVTGRHRGKSGGGSLFQEVPKKGAVQASDETQDKKSEKKTMYDLLEHTIYRKRMGSRVTGEAFEGYRRILSTHRHLQL